jgi:hypothetical protein
MEVPSLEETILDILHETQEGTESPNYCPITLDSPFKEIGFDPLDIIDILISTEDLATREKFRPDRFPKRIISSLTSGRQIVDYLTNPLEYLASYSQ